MNAKLITLFFALFIFSAYSQQGTWEKLGTRPVDHRLDKDVIMVGARKGGFSKLKIEVRGGAVNMHKMIITYKNGTKENVALRHNFGPKSGSRVIDIRGGKRVIQKITFLYDTKGITPGKAVVHVFGRH